jgi:SAM-dependent methyltransferase
VRRLCAPGLGRLSLLADDTSPACAEGRGRHVHSTDESPWLDIPGVRGAARVSMLGMASRALSFGAMAEAYERFRPGYPMELVDRVMTYAGRPIRTALEIGAGTGKATRVFADRGVAITATEPDEAMLAELRKHVAANVTTVRAAFEDLRPGDTYGLVYAAAALHWTNPEGRWSRVAALLEPGGVFASFGGPLRPTDPAVEESVRAARAPFLDSDEVPSPDGTPPEHEMQWPGTELQRSAWFTDVQQSVVHRRVTMSAGDFVGHLSTVSAYLVLPAPAREQVFSRILQVLPERVELDADLTVHLARWRSGRADR